METCDNVKMLTVGDRTWQYQAFYDDKGKCYVIRFYDAVGDFVTEFESFDDMNNFLNHTEADKVNEQLNNVKKFRNFSNDFIAEMVGKNPVEVSISVEEKEANEEVFQQRIKMLKCDMNNYEFGKLVGLGGGAIYSMFTGTKYPTAHLLKRIADKCGISADWLLGLE